MRLNPTHKNITQAPSALRVDFVSFTTLARTHFVGAGCFTAMPLIAVMVAPTMALPADTRRPVWELPNNLVSPIAGAQKGSSRTVAGASPGNRSGANEAPSFFGFRTRNQRPWTVEGNEGKAPPLSNHLIPDAERRLLAGLAASITQAPISVCAGFG